MGNEATTRRMFQFWFCPEKGGQRFFKTVQVTTVAGVGGRSAEKFSVPGPDLYVCDHSGRSPASSADGPLRLMPEKGLTISRQSDERVQITACCAVERTGGECQVLLSPIEADWAAPQHRSIDAGEAGGRRQAPARSPGQAVHGLGRRNSQDPVVANSKQPWHPAGAAFVCTLRL